MTVQLLPFRFRRSVSQQHVVAQSKVFGLQGADIVTTHRHNRSSWRFALSSSDDTCRRADVSEQFSPYYNEGCCGEKWRRAKGGRKQLLLPSQHSSFRLQAEKLARRIPVQKLSLAWNRTHPKARSIDQEL